MSTEEGKIGNLLIGFDLKIFRFESDLKVTTTLIKLLSVLTKSVQINRIQTFVNAIGLGPNEHIIAALKDAQFNLKWTDQNIPIIRDVIKRINLSG